MKKIIFSLLFTFTLMIISNVESKGQCPGCSSPYTSQSATYVYNSSCSITINFCLDCSPTGHPIMKLCSITIPYNSNCYNIPIDPTFWNNVRNEMLEKAAIVCGNIGPCTQRLAADIYQATCWKLENDWELGMVNIVPCDDEPGICMQEYEVCYDGLNLNINKIGNPVVIEEGECGTYNVIIVPPPYDLFEDCFNSCY